MLDDDDAVSEVSEDPRGRESASEDETDEDDAFPRAAHRGGQRASTAFGAWRIRRSGADACSLNIGPEAVDVRIARHRLHCLCTCSLQCLCTGHGFCSSSGRQTTLVSQAARGASADAESLHPVAFRMSSGFCRLDCNMFTPLPAAS